MTGWIPSMLLFARLIIGDNTILDSISTIYGYTYFSSNIAYVGLFLTGSYLIKERNRTKKFRKVLPIAYLMIVVISIGTTYYLSIMRGEVYYRLFDYVRPNICIEAICIFGAVTACDFDEFNKTLCQVIIKISGMTLGIYLIHPLILDIIKKLGLKIIGINSIFSIMVLGMITFVLSVLITFLLKKIPLVNKIC